MKASNNVNIFTTMRAIGTMLRLLAMLEITSAFSPAMAQGTNSSMEQNCRSHFQGVNNGSITFNSTGSTPFQLDGLEKWHLSYGLIDRRREDLVSGPRATSQTLATYLSVPETFIGSKRGNGTNYCLYLFHGQNETSDAEPGDGNSSCNGVLDSRCLSYLSQASGPPSDASCPDIDVPDECGTDIWMRYGQSVFLIELIFFSLTLCLLDSPGNFSDPECAVRRLPGINLPNGYRTYEALVGSEIPPPDSSTDSFEMYDLRVRQPVPMLIVSQSEGLPGWNAEVICLAPSNVTEGSREPEGEFPPSAASSLLPTRLTLALVLGGCLGLFVV